MELGINGDTFSVLNINRNRIKYQVDIIKKSIWQITYSNTEQ